MKTNLLKLISLKNFFKIVNSNGNDIQYCLKKPSILLIQNIYVQWLQSIWLKADKHFPVLINKPLDKVNEKPGLPIGVIESTALNFDENEIVDHDSGNFFPNRKTKLKFKLLVAEQDVMQYFLQWQRYRKFWWSSVTTSPGLFSVNDIKYGDKTAAVDIIAQLPWGNQVVEKVSFDTPYSEHHPTAALRCSTTVENALITLLADGIINNTKEGYLRIHRKLAPYKISFALECDDAETKNILIELAVVLNSKLASKNISTWFPEFNLPMGAQLKENLQIGVVYTAILSENTLSNGIFHLMNSSTMLKEQTHLADFESYATLLFRN